MRQITFKKLTQEDLPLLLKWLSAAHVKTWWDAESVWSPETVKQKYSTYIDGYKEEKYIKKPINAYFIVADEIPCGYLQCYNAYDFMRIAQLADLRASLGAFDMFIREPQFLNKEIGSTALKIFFDEFFSHSYEYIFADSHSKNTGAIRCYEKAGFKIVSIPTPEATWMLRKEA